MKEYIDLKALDECRTLSEVRTISRQLIGVIEERAQLAIDRLTDIDDSEEDDVEHIIRREFDAEAARIEQEARFTSFDVSPEEIESMRRAIEKLIDRT